MAWTGYDNPQHGDPIDVSGGGADPGYYYALAPGSPFPGSDQNYLGYNSGNPYGSPGYAPPGWLAWMASHVRGGESLLNAHSGNVNSPGAGQDPGLGTAGYPYQFFSGPGAPYGPASGPGHGLVDMGRPPGEIWDHPEWKPEGTSTSGDSKKKGHGGQQVGHFSFQPYQGLNYHSSFVDWQPAAPGTAPQGATRFVSGGGSSIPGGPTPVRPAGGQKPGKGSRGQGAGAGGGGNGAGRGPGGPNTGKPGGGGQSPSGSQAGPYSPQAEPGQAGRPRLGIGGHGTDSMFGGVDVNNIDYRTPGWLRDPTTGILNTAGMPNATPFAPTRCNRGGPNQAFDAYLNQLHDQGLSTDDIISLLGPYGYRIDNNGDFQWQWGSGPVVRGDNGYAFARQASGGGGGGAGEKPTAADNISSGWTPTARYF